MATLTLTLTLPYPPSTNHYWRHVGSRVLISAAGRTYRATVGTLLALARVPRLDGPVYLEMDCYPPDRRRRDLDNLQKCLFDSLKCGGLYGDDSQIEEYRVKRCAVIKGGKVVLRVREDMS